MSQVIRHVTAIAATIAVVVSLLSFTGGKVLAQGQSETDAPGVWQSAILIQNSSSSPATTVTITFYRADGTVALEFTPTDLPIPAGESREYYIPSIDTLSPGQFNVIATSDVQLTASVNTTSVNNDSAPWTSFAYEGIEAAQTATTLYYPGLYKNYFGFNSEMVLQNAGDTTATVSAKFYNASGTEVANVDLGSIAANGAQTFPTQSISQLPSGNTEGLFGAVVTSNVPLAGIANIWRTNGTSSYNAFTSGSQTLYVPANYKQYFGFGSALTIQNIDQSNNAAGTITYSDGTTENFDLAPNASQEFFAPNNASLPSGNTGGVFSAQVVATTGSIIGLVSLSQPDRPTERGDFGSYNVPSEAATTVNIPNILSDYFGYFSAVTVQNTGNAPTDVTITYPSGETRSFPNVPANGTINVIHLNNTDDVLPDRTTTSAVATSTGQPLVAVIQHNTASNVNGYNSTKQPSDFLLAFSGTTQ